MKKLKGNCLDCRHCLHLKSFCGGIDAPVETQWDCGITGEHLTHTRYQGAHSFLGHEFPISDCQHFEHKLQDRLYLGEICGHSADVEISCDANKRRTTHQRVYFRINLKSHRGSWTVLCDGKPLADSNSKSIDLELAIDGGLFGRDPIKSALQDMLKFMDKPGTEPENNECPCHLCVGKRGKR